jgi:DNA polymerase-3 subunit delta'
MLDQYIVKSKSFVNLCNDCKKDKMPHAVMLVSSDGVYAEKYAENLAKLLLCGNKIDGCFCNECNVCNNVQKGVHPDVIRFGKDEAISSEDAGKIIDSVIIGPYSAERKVYILYNYDEVNKTVENKLLKTLEEPPSYCMFILVVKNVNKLLQTTLSRTRKLYLEGLSIEQLTNILLKKNVEDAELVAIQSCGSLEKAESYSKNNDAKQIMNFVSGCLMNMNDTTSIVEYAFKFEEFSNQFEDVINTFALVAFDALKIKLGVSNLVDEKLNVDKIKKLAENIAITALTKIIEQTYKSNEMKDVNVVVQNIIDQFLL